MPKKNYASHINEVTVVTDLPKCRL